MVNITAENVHHILCSSVTFPCLKIGVAALGAHIHSHLKDATKGKFDLFRDPTRKEVHSMRFDLKYGKSCITVGTTATSSRLCCVRSSGYHTTVVRKNSAAGLAHFNEIWFFGGLPLQKTCHSTTCQSRRFLSFQHGIPSEIFRP